MNRELFHKVFEDRVSVSDSQAAIAEPTGVVTYGELNGMSNQLASFLAAKGVLPGVTVAVLHSGPILQVQSMIAIFKSGGVYMPLDTSCSASRITQMFEQASCNYVVTDQENLFWLQQQFESVNIHPAHIIVLPLPVSGKWPAASRFQEAVSFDEGVTVFFSYNTGEYKEEPVMLSSFSAENLSVQLTGNNAAYIFYTSGSTGRGKGIIGRHGSLAHYINWHTEEFKIGKGVRISQIAPYCFDASLKDILTALSGGATLYSPGKMERENMSLLARWLYNNEITVLQTVPSVFRLLTAAIKEAGVHLSSLKQVVLAGERLYGSDIMNWRGTGSVAELSNLYGLTETTILKSCYHIGNKEYAAGDIIPVGKAIPDTNLLVINDDMLCDEGELGEVFIQSSYVSDGYIEPELNSTLFVRNPLVTDREEIICRTGDLGRYKADGNLEIVGRRDEQVKINGVRIELAEVRSAILSLPGIEQVELVIQQDAAHNQEMICYYLGTEQSAETFHVLLVSTLNRQLVPAYFVWLDEFPLNVNGKVDRKALPRPGYASAFGEDDLPEGTYEKGLADLWGQVLGQKRQVRRDDTFFSMGGSSLKAIQLISRIYKEYEVQLTIADIFNTPQLRLQADLIARTVKDRFRPVEHIPDEEYYDLSYSQRRLWVLHQLNGKMTAYSRPAAFTLEGAVDASAFRTAVETLVARHESLRTFFKEVNGVPKQFIQENPKTETYYHYSDISNLKDKHTKVTEKLSFLSTRHYDLEKGPLFEVYLFRTGPEEFQLLLGIHHIISDEWSLQVMMNEVAVCYNRCLHKEVIPLQPLQIQYRDYAAWQKVVLSGKGLEPAREFWLNKLSGELPVLDMQADFIRPIVQTFNGRQVRTVIEKEAAKRLSIFCESRGATLFMGLTAIIKVLLYRYTGQTDIIVGTPVAGRDHPDLEGQIGFYVNTLALRTNISADKGFNNLLDNVKSTVLEALDNQFYPFDKLVDELNISRDISRSPVFDVALVLQNVQLNTDTGYQLSGVEMYPAPAEVITSLYDLTFWFTEAQDGIILNLEYNTDIFAAERIGRMVRHFEVLYYSIIKEPDLPVRELEYLSDEEKEELLYEFNNTTAAYPREKTITDLFEKQAGERGAIEALICGDTRLSYAEINKKANKLAHFLRAKYNVKPDQPVGLLMERSEQMIIGMLGILKSGAAYVPIDTAFPSARIQYIIEDSLISVLVTDKADWGDKMISINPSDSVLDGFSEKDPERRHGPGNLAYIIYTSGSTGRPKGVMIRHGSVVNFLYSVIGHLDITPMDRWLSVTTISFDISVLEIFAPLVSGASLILAESSDLSNSLKAVALIEREEPSIMQATPSFWNLIADAGWDGNPDITILVGGEALPFTLGKKLRGLCGTLLNMYGPTETTIWSTFKMILRDEDCQLIGKPLANTTVYILDENRRLVPKGIPGKLYIGGHGLARGYYRREELTSEKFINAAVNGEERVYDTGDRCMWTNEGELKFLGRTDFMIKLRGYRIELGEIEQLLREEFSLSEVITVLQNLDGEEYIVAYFTAKEKLDAGVLASELRNRLPEYMVPSYFVQLERLPLNTNGKIDRKALPMPSGAVKDEHVAPRNITESKLAEIWKEVLGKESVGINDNFFIEGGHSLRAIQLVSRIYKTFSVQLELKDVFLNPVLKGQAGLITNALPEIYRPVEKIPDGEYYSLSHSQYRLWLLDKIEGVSNTYVIPASYRIRGDINVEYLERAFNILIERHEILRTVFLEPNGTPVQYIRDANNAHFTIGITDLNNRPDALILARENGKAFAMSPFRLNEWPLMRAHIWRTGEEEYLFYFGIHHIITDEWSMQTLIRELLLVYNALVNEEEVQLPSLRIQYRDYAFWHNMELTAERLQYHKSFWMEKLGDELPVLELPSDFPRPPHKTYNGGQAGFIIPADMVNRLRIICDENGASVFMGFTALVNAILFRYSGSKDIIIGTPVAGRDHSDLEGQLGFFVNNLVLRNEIFPEKGFAHLLSIVRDNMLEAFRHQSYPFDKLVEDLDLVRDNSRNPLFDVVVNWQNAEAAEGILPVAAGIEVEDNIFEPGVTKADITFLLREPASPEDDLYMLMEYNTDLFLPERIQRMGQHFKQLLDAVTRNPGVAIAKVNFIEEQELALIGKFSFRPMEFPEQETLVSLFERQVQETPDGIALIFEDRSITYTEMNRQVNLLARRFLAEDKLGPGRIGAVLQDRSEWMIISIMAVLKTGAAYMPIDPAYPAERIMYMIRDAHPHLLITESHYLFNLTDAGTSFFIIDVESEHLQGDDSDPVAVVQPGELAYVIYTSGSTGEPKGVMVEHRSCVNMITNQREVFSLTKEDRILQYSSLSFDGAVAEIFATLSTGAALVVTPSFFVKDAAGLVKYMESKGVTMAIWPSAFLNTVGQDKISFLKKLVSAGDVANINDAIACSKAFAYFNCYGPTESTVWATFYKVVPERDSNYNRLPIGYPIGNVGIHILNDSLELQPLGIPGEICISGVSIARGYLGKPGLTAEKFVNDPHGNGKMYRTGDVGRWLEDGSIDFLGRKDEQVKIRGYRIETGEIEKVIQKHEKTGQVAVKVFGEKTDKFLAAYYTAQDSITVDEIRAFVSKRLPEYMIPSYFIQVDTMPVNASGKINRRALPKPELSRTYVAPKTATEMLLVDVWTEILGLSRVSAEDNFFSIGGQSLKAIQVVNSLSQKLGRQIKVAELFEYPQLYAFAKQLDDTIVNSFEPIPRTADAEYYPLTHGQRRFWVLEQFEGMSAVYVLPASYWLRGPVDYKMLENAFIAVIERHESLRTVFQTVEGNPMQFVLPAKRISFSIQYEDYYLVNDADAAVMARERIGKESLLPFDLEKGPLFRVLLSRTGEKEFLLTLSIHHIISDEWSVQVMIHEVLSYYKAFINGEEFFTEPLPIQYKDYAVWQENELKGDKLNDHRKYWVDKLSGELPQLDFPSDRPRPKTQTYRGSQYRHNFRGPTSTAFSGFCQDNAATLFMGLVALTDVILYRYTGQEDIIIGSPVAGREHPDLASQIGYFVNTLPLRQRMNGRDNFVRFLSDVKTNILESFRHQVYPFDKLIDELEVSRDISRAPVFDIVVVLQNARQLHGLETSFEGVEVEEFLAEVPVSKTDLRLFFTENDESITLTLDYNTDLFDREKMQRLALHFEQLMLSVLADPLCEIQKLSYIPDEEKRKLLYDFNPLSHSEGLEHDIIDRFEEHCRNSPNLTALIYGDQQWTYSELNAQVNKMANCLIGQKKILPGQVVGVMTDRNEWMIISALAVLKAGAVYLPIDPSYPAERIQYMLSDGNAVLLISESAYLFNKPEYDGEIFWADIELDGQEDNCNNPARMSSFDDVVYIIYTSGSTGKPKGVMVSYKSCSNLLYNQEQTFGVSASDRILQFSSIAFDGSFFEFIFALCHGAALVLIPGAISRDGLKLVDYMQSAGVSMAVLPSAFLDTLDLDKLRFLRVLVTAGDVANMKNAVYCSGFTFLYNGYGPTESTVWAAGYQVRPEDTERQRIPIGKPVRNSAAYVLDKHLGLLPVGVPGELCLAGASLATGYVNNPEMTDEKFITNPFGDGKLYRTGDRVCWLSDGNLDFIGRADNQIKIRGYRIEIDEIEKVMMECDETELAAVSVFGEGNSKYLAGFYTSKNDLTPEKLKESMLKSMPEYMVPAYITRLESMPLNSNGKVDRRKLPIPGQSGLKEFIAPRTETETQLSLIWKQVLNLELISAEDNFFAIGGNSLKAVQLISLIYKHLNIQVAIGEIFNQPVLSALAVIIDNLKETSFLHIQPVPDKEDYPLSYSQQRLWLQEQYRQDSVPYNAAGVFVLKGRLDISAFNRAFLTLVERHESLRTVFITKDNITRQKVKKLSESGFDVVFIDLMNDSNPSEGARKIAYDLSNEPFDLSKGPLLKVRLIQTLADEYLFVLAIHHIISDEWSMQVMLRELVLLYNAFSSGKENPLKPLPVQYRDYTAWEAAELSGERLILHRNYWHNTLAAPLPVLQLPTDRPRPLVQTFRGSHYNFRIPGEHLDGLKQICLGQRATLFMGLAALIKVLLYKYSGQTDIIIGTPIAGRDHPDLDGQIGYYLNTIALRTNIDPADGFTDLLSVVKKNTLEGFSHQAYPFDRLVEELNLEHDPSRAPIFDVTLILQNIQLYPDDLGINGITSGTMEVDLQISKGDLRFQFTEQPGHLDANIEYNSDLFNRPRIVKMAEHLLDLLTSILGNKDTAIKNLDYKKVSQDRIRREFSAPAKKEQYQPVDMLFRQAAKMHPDIVAAECDGQTITYSQLDVQADIVSRILNGIVKNSSQTVAVLLSPDIRLPGSMLAVFRSGHIYLPLDKSFSSLRLKQIFEETSPVCLVAGSEDEEWIAAQLKELSEVQLTVILIPENQTSEIRVALLKPEGNLVFLEAAGLDCSESNQGNDNAYIFYTSGSTGKGKGIMGSHQSLSQYVMWHAKQFDFGIGKRISQVASAGFDASLKDILPALISGATVCIPPVRVRDNITLLGSWLKESGINVLQTVPSLFRLLIRSTKETGLTYPDLRLLVLAGEKLYGRDVDNWRKSGGGTADIYNLYGLTETTILKTYYAVGDKGFEPGETIPAGKPIDEAMLAVINDGRICAEGEIGEVYIKSAYLSNGYLQDELNKDHFVQNPAHNEYTDIVYRTGDTGRFLDDGNLEILGRRDEQVKVGGVRVELGEVRHAMLQVKGVEQVELSVQEDGEGHSVLLCHYTGTEYEHKELREALVPRLNRQLLPSYYCWLPEFPLNVNGKVDKKKLPKPDALLQSSGYESPANETEEKLAAIWRQVLDIQNRIGRKDNFFSLGGSSLRAIQLISRIYRDFDVQLTIAEVFNAPEMMAQADMIQKASYFKFQSVVHVEDQPWYDLSFAQRRLWIQHTQNEDQATYNIPMQYKLIGELDVTALEKAFAAVIKRHESLRTIFEVRDGKPVQRILSEEDTGFFIEQKDMRSDMDSEARAQADADLFCLRSFRLNDPPLLRVKLARIGDKEWILALVIHHIIADEWSMQVLASDLIQAYNAALMGEVPDIPPLNNQYRDFVAWQKAALTGDRLNAHRRYWLGRFEGELPVMDIPSDYPRPPVQTFNGNQLQFIIPAGISKSFSQYCESRGATLFMGLTAVLQTLLYQYSGQHDQIIGTPLAGRDHPDLENQVGYYLNTVAIRTKLNSKNGFAALLDQVKKATLEAFEHRAYPFDLLVEELNLNRDMSRSPLFDVAIILQNVQFGKFGKLNMLGVEIEPVRPDTHTSKGDIRFQFTPEGDVMTMDIEYNTDIFSSDRIIKMSNHYLKLVTSVLADPGKPLSMLEYLSDIENQAVQQQAGIFGSVIDADF